MNESGSSWQDRVRDAVMVGARLLAYAAMLLVFTVLIASPLVMLRTTLLAAGPVAEENELRDIAGAIAAVLATALAMRLFHHARLRDAGLNWRRPDRRNLLLGLAGGVAGGLLVTALPVLVGAADLKPIENSASDLRNLVYYCFIILVSAAGEEIQVRGFLFQTLARSMGLVPTLLLTSAVFAAAHLPNPNASLAAVVNTFLFGAALGFAMWRSGSLWLPIGLHAGWNLTLPLFGANLSGYAYRLTKFEISWNIPASWTGGSYGPEGGFLATAAILGWIYYLHTAPIVHQEAFLLSANATTVFKPDEADAPSIIDTAER